MQPEKHAGWSQLMAMDEMDIPREPILQDARWAMLGERSRADDAQHRVAMTRGARVTSE